MTEVMYSYYLYFAAFLFSAGTFVVLTKRSAVFVLIGVELMLNAGNLLLVTFGNYHNHLQGQVFAIFSIVLTVCEVAIALAILLNLYRRYRLSNLDEFNEIGND